jgi:hypothetical protein
LGLAFLPPDVYLVSAEQPASLLPVIKFTPSRDIVFLLFGFGSSFLGGPKSGFMNPTAGATTKAATDRSLSI